MCEADIRAAVLDLYDALGAADIERLARRVCRDGFSEFAGSGGGRLLQEDSLVDIQRALEAGLQVRVTVRHLDIVELEPGVALATGYRFGTMTPAGQVVGPPETHRLSMVLLWQDQSWRLRHVHYSLVSPR